MKKKGTRMLTGLPGNRRQKFMRRAMVLLLIITCLATMGSFFAVPDAVKAAADPTLVAYDVTPTTVWAGNTVTLSYTINNPEAAAVDVALGASMMNPNLNYFNDPDGNDIVISAAPGTATYTRTFRIPDDAVAGLYTVLWGIWNGNFTQQYQLAWRSYYLNVVRAPTLTIAFDDGYDAIYQNGFPIIDAAGFQATVFQITGLSAVEGAPLMSVTQLQYLKSHGWEIASHTQNHIRLSGLTIEQQRAEMVDSRQWLIDNGLGPVYALAYPFGDANANTYAVAAESYKYSRTVIEGINDYGPSVNLATYFLWGNASYNSLSLCEQAVTAAYNQNKWVIVTSHGVVANQNDPKLNSTYGWVTTDVLTEFVQFVQNLGIPVKTFAELEGQVVPVNHAPVAAADAYTAIRNQTLTVAAPGVLSNDVDSDTDALTAVLAAGTSHGTLTLAANGSFTYTPTTGYTGTDTFTYNASDTKANSNTATVTITVTAPNNTPVAVNNSYAVNEDAGLTVAAPGILGNDTDADGDTLTAAVVAGVSHGTLTLAANGSFTYAPAANYNGSDNFTYVANDGKINSNTATVNITVAPVNDAPLAVLDSYGTTRNIALTIAAPGVLANDTDIDGNTLTAALYSGVAHGALAFNANGSFTYTPNTNYVGSDSFIYRVYDGIVYSNTTTVTLTVTSVPTTATVTLTFDDGYTAVYQNALPLLNSYGYQGTSFVITGLSSIEGIPLMNLTQLQALKAAGWDIESHSVNHQFLTSLDQTALETELTSSRNWINNNGLGPVYAFAYPYGATNSNVIATTGTYYKYARTTDEGTNDYGASTTLRVAKLWGNSSYSSLHNVKEIIQLAQSQNKWVIVLAHGVVTDPTDYRLNSNYGWVTTDVLNELLQFIKDNAIPVKTFAQIEGESGPANHAPVAVNNSYSTNEDTTLTVTTAGVLGNDTDADGNTLSASLMSGVSHGTLTLNSNGSFTYVPAANYNGSDSFTYAANDGSTNSNTATVSLTITAVNDAPVAVNDSYNTQTDTALTVAAPGVLSNDTDVEGNTLTASRLTNPSHGTLSFNSNGSFTYTPSTGYTGSDSFTYRANDGSANSNTATVTLTVATAVNNAPVAANNSYTTSEDTMLTVAAPGVLSNDTDADGDALTAALVSSVAHGTLTLNANGSFTYIPAADYNGSDSFTYRANDGKTNSNTATVSLTITAVNDAPVAVNDSYSVIQAGILTIAAPGVLANDTDAEGSTLTATRMSTPAHGTLTFNSNGSFTYTPTYSYTGTDSFTYRVSDGTANSNTATVVINVNGAVSGTTFGLDVPTNNYYQWENGEGVIEAQRFANNAGTGTLSKLELYLDPTFSANGNVRLAVYADNNGVPGALLLDAGSTSAASGWTSISGLSLPVTQGTYYWLVFNNSAGAHLIDVAGPAGDHCWLNYAYGAYPAQFPANAIYNQWQYVMRATVSP
jgi:VCBS repeat-containing protein